MDLPETSDEISDTSNSSLSKAVIRSEHDRVRQCIANGADPNHDGVLMWAVWMDNLRMVELLVALGADPKEDNSAALADAWMENRPAIVEFLYPRSNPKAAVLHLQENFDTDDSDVANALARLQRRIVKEERVALNKVVRRKNTPPSKPKM